jgi:hypothetical protein
LVRAAGVATAHIDYGMEGYTEQMDWLSNMPTDEEAGWGSGRAASTGAAGGPSLIRPPSPPPQLDSLVATVAEADKALGGWKDVRRQVTVHLPEGRVARQTNQDGSLTTLPARKEDRPTREGIQLDPRADRTEHVMIINRQVQHVGWSGRPQNQFAALDAPAPPPPPTRMTPQKLFPMRKFSFASVNMRRRNAAMHALLNDNEGEDVLFVQEPWFNPVGTVRCDMMYQGKDILGGAAHPKWRLAYPSFTNGQRAKVMTYVRIHDRSLIFRKNHCQMIVRNDLVSHPCLLVTDFRVGSYYWRVLNFYNDVADPSALNTLLGLDLDATIPTLVIRDFNLHSTSWSPTGWATSSGAHRLEEWMATQTFALLNKPRMPTHMGEAGARNSTIDLAWSNMAATMQGTFFGAQIDYGGSMGSDHALIRIIASTPAHVSRAPEDRTNRFNTDIDADAWEEWNRILRFELPPLSPILSTHDLDSRVDNIYRAFNEACKSTMKRVGAAPGFNLRWWNDECKAAAKATKEGFWTEEEARAANKHLKKVVREAKRNWANDYISTANIWEVAAWRHGRRSSLIPALLGQDGNLVYDHEGMASLLSARFFAEEGTPIPTHFHDDPPPRPPQQFHPFEEEEIGPLLKATSNKSAPGSSGIDWSLLKKGWDAVKDHLVDVFNACLTLGHHPHHWKEAKVVAIPKPDKPDYSLPKAHRPISLLETMSKLLEKAIAKRMQHDIVAHEPVHTNQFGGRAHSLCLDTGLALLHDVQSAHRAGLKAGILLFDVRGFFDNVNHGRMSAILENLGYPPELVRWSAAFLSDRKVRLSFNNSVSEERGQPIGVPQGSPLSPVFSITYTSSLLSKMMGWKNSSLGMYVDDGILFACAQEWEEVERLLRVTVGRP